MVIWSKTDGNPSCFGFNKCCIINTHISFQQIGGIMKDQWMVNYTCVQNGSKLFESFDIETYEKASHDYFDLTVVDKMQYKGVEDYVKQTTGIECSPLNNNYKKIHDEIEARFSSPLEIKPLVIDTVF